ncbi:hypothetical protein PIB30_095663 [Stylosanthes scabra]|uniref:Uncharacterized protein n=1 Tax=Stylosanthes scabra TaxID=79078 RepID=A0ABU6UUQ3_9FABA|nr:hypothetical protein [Stylosanthes scabra]
MKSVEPRLTIAAEAERLNAKLLGDVKALNLQRMVLEEEKADAVQAKLKVEEDLKVLKVELEKSDRERKVEIDRLKHREEGLLSEVERFRGLAAEEKVRADLAEASSADLHKQCEDLAEDAKAAVAATEGALKAQLAVLLPDFDTDQLSFFKDIVDGKPSLHIFTLCHDLLCLGFLIRRRIIPCSIVSFCDSGTLLMKGSSMGLNRKFRNRS